MGISEASPEWAAGSCDECWWSRLALPTLSSWAQEGKPMRLVQQSVAKDDPDPKAISCYGLYVPELDRTWSRFVGWPAGERDNGSVPFVVYREARSGWQEEGPAPHLGRRQLAHHKKP
jgi:hypothetical protein